MANMTPSKGGRSDSSPQSQQDAGSANAPQDPRAYAPTAGPAHAPQGAYPYAGPVNNFQGPHQYAAHAGQYNAAQNPYMYGAPSSFGMTFANYQNPAQYQLTAYQQWFPQQQQPQMFTPNFQQFGQAPFAPNYQYGQRQSATQAPPDWFTPNHQLGGSSSVPAPVPAPTFNIRDGYGQPKPKKKKNKKNKMGTNVGPRPLTFYRPTIPVRPSTALAPAPAPMPTGRHKEPKTMLPAPAPSAAYMYQATTGTPKVASYPAGRKLVILDLNGTVLYRPNRNPKSMIGRASLDDFLKYLFKNFSVMVWSSARPENVKALAECALKAYEPLLVARWARNTLGLSPKHYEMNVQCYKNLELVWASEVIQSQIPGYNFGDRFNQSNTILIDDSVLKANAQPYNLLEIPEFNGQREQQDILGEVAGYLEIVKVQEDVSRFIFRTPFKANRTWGYDWKTLAEPEK